MKKIILIASFISSAAAINAQQLQNSSLYDMQGSLFNPSLAGVQQDPSIKGIMGATYRTQWSGMSGAPRTITLFGSFAMPLQRQNRTNFQNRITIGNG